MDRQIYSLLLLAAQPSLHSGAARGAGDGTRTRDLLITNQLLYQLSYASTKPMISKTHSACTDANERVRVAAGAAEELRVIADGQTWCK
jgi:hypothetical protein